jgi:RNA polymerase-binding transcription factor DksA
LREENERLTCISDQASQVEAGHLEAALDAARWAARQKQQPLADGSYAVTECEDCGEEIGEGRLHVASNNHICINCANERDHKRKLQWLPQ